MADRLSDEEMEVYSRQLMIDEIGFEGQLELKRSRVLLVGIGGLGVPIALQLTGMGVGHLRIVDRDIVSLSDLHRQYLYDVGSVGLAKVEVATSRLSALNPNTVIEPVPVSIKPWNIMDLVEDCDLVIDGLDSVETRYLVNRACVKHGIPYVYGGAIRTQGSVSTILPKRTACLECFMPNLTDEEMPKCAIAGVYPPVLGMVASVEVSEAVHFLVGRQPRLAGKLLYVDIPSLSFDEVTLARNDKCAVCGDTPGGSLDALSERLVEEECARSGRRTLIVTPRRWLEIDLEATVNEVGDRGYAVDKEGKLGVTFSDEKGLVVSLLKTGVAIFQFPPSRASRDIHNEATVLYRGLLAETLGLLPQDALPPELVQSTLKERPM